MIEFKRKIRKWGNSFAVALPIEAMIALKMHVNSEVILSVVNGEIRIKLSKGEAN